MYVCVFYITYVCIYKLNPHYIGIVVCSCKVMSDICDPMNCSKPGFPVLSSTSLAEAVVPGCRGAGEVSES